MSGFSKAKLPRGMSFPLKRSVLDAALLEGGVTKLAMVYYNLGQRTSAVTPIVFAEYTSEAERGWAAAGTSSIIVYAVPSAERHVMEMAISATVLPALIRWLLQIEKAGSGPRAMRHQFSATWEDGAFSVYTS